MFITSDLTRKYFLNANNTERGKLSLCGRLIYVAQFVLIVLEKQNVVV